MTYPKPLHTEPSKVSYGGRIIKFRITIIDDKTNGMNCNYKFPYLQKTGLLQL